MKIFFLNILANSIYYFYLKKIFINKLKVNSIKETIDELLNTEKSFVRFGDGELNIIRGFESISQKSQTDLGKRLETIIRYEEENLIVGIPDIFEDLSKYNVKSRVFWKKHLYEYRKDYYKYCDISKKYYNAFFSRCYLILEDKSQCYQYFQDIKKIWYNKKVIIVEGRGTHNGVGNDLLSCAKEVKRILCPSKDAYSKYEIILEQCLKQTKEVLFLLSIGATSKILGTDLFFYGYRVIDIGNLDLEYEWFLKQTSEKIPLKKHACVNKIENIEAGYVDYVNEIIFEV